MTLRATHGAATHVGQVRRDNEDAFVAIDGLYMVADGMGGHSAGEVASALAITTLKDAYTSTNPGLHTAEQVAEAVALANTAVFVEALDDSAKSGMGTTLTGLVVTDGDSHEIVVANVGDSRTYLWRQGELRQITKDHSHVQTLVDRGAITQAEARVHYQRNIVLRAVGIDAEVKVDLFPLTVEDGDRFILCSDGLVDEADDDEIINEIRLRSTPQDLADRLVQLANDNGGRDNVTVVVVDFAITESPATSSSTVVSTVTSPVASTATATATDSESVPTPESSASIAESNATVETATPKRTGAWWRSRSRVIGVVIAGVVTGVAVLIAVITAL